MRSEPDFPVYHPDGGPGDVYDDNGVDLTQVRAMLDLTPEQRLRLVEGFAEDTLRVWARSGVRPVR